MAAGAGFLISISQINVRMEEHWNSKVYSSNKDSEF